MRLTWISILLGIGLVLSSGGLAQDSESESVGTDESETPEAVSEDHTVVNGDNLWDLCGHYLNNAWYWPRVWSYNPEITNPHWIFPGQVVRFYPGGEGPGQMDLVSREIGFPDEPEIELEDEVLAPEDLVSLSGRIVKAKSVRSVNILRNTFITKTEMESMGYISGSSEEVEYLSELNMVYLKFDKSSSVQVDQMLSISRTSEEPILHPVTGEPVGYQVNILGACRVVNVYDNHVAKALITSSVDSIERGDRVGPILENLTKPVDFQPNGVEVRGHIVAASVSRMENYGESHLVYIDQGSQQGVREGNVFDVVRRHDSFIIPESGKSVLDWDESVPIETWGRIMVVDSKPTASTGIVIASLRELIPGDQVVMTVQ